MEIVIKFSIKNLYASHIGICFKI